MANANVAGDGASEGGGMSAQAKIWRRFRPQVLERVDTLEQAALAQLEGRLDASMRSSAEREAHRLAGAVGTFGFERASRLAREAEQILIGTGDLPATSVARLSEVVLDLRTELEASYRDDGPSLNAGGQAVTGRAELSGIAQIVSRFWLVCVDADRAEGISMEAHGRGHHLRIFDTVAEAVAALETETPPAAVLIDLTAVDADPTLWADVGQLTRCELELPVVILGDGNRFDDRLAAAREHVTTFLTLPAQAATLVDALSDASTRVAGASILVVDDDPGELASVTDALQQAGATVTAIDDPRQFWSTLRRVSPDVIVLGAEMPDIDGFDLCRITRSDPRWRTVPVIFLTAVEGGTVLRRILEAGGDDYLPTPIDSVQLVRRVAASLARLRDAQVRAGYDSLTGVPGRRLFVEAAQRFLEIAKRTGKPLTLILVQVDHLRRTNTDRGIAAGDEVLRRIARRLETSLPHIDVLGRWSGSVFAVVVLGEPPASVAEQLPRLVDPIQATGISLADGTSVRVSLSCGVAGYPDDGDDLSPIAKAAEADRSSNASSRRGDAGAADTGHRDPPRSRQVDVLVVDDDPVLASLLGHTIRSEGHSDYWIEDGQRAVDLLTAEPPRLSARLILLDVNLPGMDGYTVLHTLREAGVLARTRVMMLTVRATEDEIVRALRAGAMDHVAKPFSLPVLMEKLRHGLDS